MKIQSTSGRWFCAYDVAEPFHFEGTDWLAGTYYLSGAECQNQGW